MQLYQQMFRKGAILTAVTGVTLLLFSACLGNQAAFLLLNTNLGAAADFFFYYLTYLGDGIIWIPVFLGFLLYRRKLLPLLIGTILFSTLIAQGVKNFVFPGQPRPTKAISELSLIHTVPGVELHTINSFPSGHTTTAFSLFLLICLLTPRRNIVYPAFILAILVSYSRIYLGQHFPADLGGGMIAAVISVWVSLWLQQKMVRNI